MKAFAALVFMSLLSLTAFSHDVHEHGRTTPTAPQAGDKSALICTTDNSICAQLQFLANVNSSEEGSFLAAVTTPDNKTINNLKIDIWMSMGSNGHGSAPVEIEDAGNNMVKVTNAWFVMPGTWLIRLDFDFEGVHQHLEIPVYAAN